ncbi:aminopeptidase P family N-terminal domain-containing protein, partial [Prevotella corporis]
KASAWDGDVIGYLDSENPWNIIATNVKKRTHDTHNWAIEKDDLSVAHYQLLRGEFPNASFTNDVSPFIEKLRLYKTPEEIKKLQGAGAEADFAFKI